MMKAVFSLWIVYQPNIDSPVAWSKLESTDNYEMCSAIADLKNHARADIHYYYVCQPAEWAPASRTP
jgi:hypothetical protein